MRALEPGPLWAVAVLVLEGPRENEGLFTAPMLMGYEALTWRPVNEGCAFAFEAVQWLDFEFALTRQPWMIIGAWLRNSCFDAVYGQ